MRRAATGVLALLMPIVLVTALALPGTARADDIKLQKILRNGMYGAAVGALIGAALLAFKSDPGDHLEFITVGAASGVLVGVAWGVYDSATDNPYVMIEHGHVRTALATPRLKMVAPSAADRTRREALVAVPLAAVRF
jgi:hypothetical protein